MSCYAVRGVAKPIKRGIVRDPSGVLRGELRAGADAHMAIGTTSKLPRRSTSIRMPCRSWAMNVSAQLVAQPVVQGLHGVKVQIGAPLGRILVVIEITPAGDGGAHAGVAAGLDVAHVIPHI